MSKEPNPGPEIVGDYKVVYPIYRDDLAECVMMLMPRGSIKTTVAADEGPNIEWILKDKK